MSKKITKAQLTRLLKGSPKRVTRGSISRIVELAQEVIESGIAFYPYYSKTKPEHEAFKYSETRRLLEREIGAFFYTTGNWEDVHGGVDVCAVWKTEALNVELEAAGFHVREQNTAKRNLADDAETSADEAEPEVV